MRTLKRQRGRVGRDFGFGDFSDRSGEPVTKPWERLDVVLLTRAFSQDLAKCGNVYVKVCFFDYGVRPESVLKTVPPQNLRRVSDQQQEQIEFLWRKRHRFGVPVEPVFLRRQAKYPELIEVLSLTGN